MPTVDVYNLEHKKVGTLKLSDEVFGQEPREDIVWEVVKAQRARQRLGTAATKTRSDVAGSGIKPFRQKHTGRARQGGVSGPHQKGGGVAFGPHPRSYAYQVPKKVRKAALRSVLSARAKETRLHVVKDFQLAEIKTKRLAQILQGFGLNKALLVDAKDNLNLKKSARNLADFAFCPVDAVTLMDLMRYENLVISESSVKKLEEGLKP
jgi:large subunit ribosomal protein L4